MADTALDRFQRILQLLPLAARDEGIGYAELAQALGITRDRLDRDLAEIAEREYYHTADTGGDIQIILESDRVRVWTAGHLRRPNRFTPGEVAALDLGLRMLATERDDPGLLHGMRALLERLGRSATGPEPDASRVSEHVVADGDPGGADPVRSLLVDAARRRFRVRFRYLKPEADAPEDRAVEPYTVVYAEGHWYVVGRSPERDGVRIFRADRILDATLDTATFDPPTGFDPADYITGGRVYQADEEMEVVVRYGVSVAPWVLERGEGEVSADGSVVIRHRVADPAWIVRQVLRYGPEARVLQPAWVAGLVQRAAATLGEGRGPGIPTSQSPDAAP